MAKIKLVIDGQVQLSRNLRVFSGKISNMKDFYQDAVKVVEDRTDDIFRQKGSNVEKSNKWEKLSAGTLRARERRYGYYKKTPNRPSVLRWTGRLQEDLTKIVTSTRGKLTFNAPYAIYHQRGGGNLPKRVIVDLSRQTNTEIVKALQKKVQRDMGIFGRQV